MMAIAAAAALVAAVILGYWMRFAAHLPPDTPTPSPLEKPSLAVLPFDNLSGDPDMDFFSDGLTEDLITQLATYREITVAARNSSFKYKGQSVDVREIGKDLGVRYVLEGSVRASDAADSVRVTVQLIDARSGKHLWAERYDRPYKDVLALHDDIVDKIEVAVDVKLMGGEEVLGRRGSTRSYEAWKLYRRALDRFYELTPAGNDQAIRLLERAIATDPDFGAGLSLVGWAHHSRAAFGWSRDPHKDLESAWSYVQRALEANPNQVEAHMLGGFLLVYRNRIEEGRHMAARAVELDPGNASAVGVEGIVLNWSGAPELGLAKMKRAMEMSPFPPPWMDLETGHAYLAMRQPQTAIPFLERTVQKVPQWLPARWLLAVAYAEAGRMEGAKAQVAKVREIDPFITLTTPNIQMTLHPDKEFVRRTFAALKAAGLD
jgi:adenylate cyclase